MIDLSYTLLIARFVFEVTLEIKYFIFVLVYQYDTFTDVSLNLLMGIII
jgi:hypothetical protein